MNGPVPFLTRPTPDEPTIEWGKIVFEQMAAAKRRLEQANVRGPYSAVLGERDWKSLSMAIGIVDQLVHWNPVDSPKPPEWAPLHAKWVCTIGGIDVFLA